MDIELLRPRHSHDRLTQMRMRIRNDLRLKTSTCRMTRAADYFCSRLNISILRPIRFHYYYFMKRHTATVPVAHGQTFRKLVVQRRQQERDYNNNNNSDYISRRLFGRRWTRWSTPDPGENVVAENSTPLAYSRNPKTMQQQIYCPGLHFFHRTQSLRRGY